MAKATCTIVTTKGEKVCVQKLAEFTREIQGESFTFIVHRDIDALTCSVSHKGSGMRVCALGVGASYLPAYAKLRNEKARGEMALQQVIDKHGAPRVACVISAAPNL